MKKKTSKPDDLNINNFKDGRNRSHYILHDYEPLDFANIPCNPNTLSFTDPLMNLKLAKTLYCAKDNENKPSKDFQTNLIVFYIFLNSFLMVQLIFSIMMNSSNDMSKEILLFHLVFISFIATLAHLLLLGIYKVPFILINNKYFFVLLALITFFYLIIGNESILSTIFNAKNTCKLLPNSVSIICFIVVFRMILFDSYLLFFCVCFFVIVFYIVLNLTLSTFGIYSIFSEFCLIAIFLVLQVIDTQLADVRTRLLF